MREASIRLENIETRHGNRYRYGFTKTSKHNLTRRISLSICEHICLIMLQMINSWPIPPHKIIAVYKKTDTYAS